MRYYADEFMTLKERLKHHGIKNMKWGDRNGPPYPLSRSAMSSAERKANPAKEQSYGDPYLAVAMAIQLLPVAVMAAASGIDVSISKSREKKFKKERENAPVDKKTGLKLKNQELTLKEDIKRVNPGFPYAEGTTNNCVLCSTALELRRRGFDVAAKQTDEGFTKEQWSKMFPGAKVKNISSKDSFGITSYEKMVKNAKEEICKQPNGARGTLLVTWKNTYSGHSVGYEVENGKLKIIDAQIGKIYKNPDDLLNDASAISYVRLDNLKIDSKFIKGGLR